MAIEASKRIFKYGDILLPDPDETMDEKAVLVWYSEDYPELLTAGFSPPDIKVDGKGVTVVTYEIKKQVGTKG